MLDHVVLYAALFLTLPPELNYNNLFVVFVYILRKANKMHPHLLVHRNPWLTKNILWGLIAAYSCTSKWVLCLKCYLPGKRSCNFPHLSSSLASRLAGTNQWAELWGLCDDFDGHLHQPGAVSDFGEQNLVGKHQPSRSRHPGVNWRFLFLPSRCRQPVKSADIMVGPLWFGAVTYSAYCIF